jgi:hypothetical protein
MKKDGHKTVVEAAFLPFYTISSVRSFSFMRGNISFFSKRIERLLVAAAE